MRNLFAAVAVVCVAGPVFAQPADKTLSTQTYDLKPILGERGKASGLADADAVIKLILETISVGELKPGTDGPQFVMRDGGILEVRATEQVHGEIKDLLAALERLADVAVDVKADVFEFDPAAYEKLMKVLPKPAEGKPALPVLFQTGEDAVEQNPMPEGLKEANAILKAGRVVQTSSGRFANGAEATFSARQSVLTFTQPGAQPNPQFVKEGFKLVGVPVVSADRRFVRFKLTEQSTTVVGMRKRAVGDVEGKPLGLVAQSPELQDLGATGSAVVVDGGTLLFKLAYAPKDKVWVVVLRPTIFIQAEEDAVKK